MMENDTKFAAILKDLGNKNEKLQEHQLEGLSVLWKWHEEGRGGIVADEMGLGKTCMTIVHLSRLLWDGHGPFIVFCPLSVTDHWRQEITRFSCGKLEPVAYIGRKDEREQIVNNIGCRLEKNQVLIVPYHIFTKYSEELSSLLGTSQFSHIVSDEAHQLKNPDSQISQLIRQLTGTFILLTGTPVQNNISELHSLLSLCNSEQFPIDDIKNFVSKYSAQSRVNELREILKEYSIRRTKESISMQLPPMSQVVFYHGLTPKQKELYINILVRNRRAISIRQDLSLINRLMHVRKAVLHPYLFPGQEPEPFTEGEHIVLASEKMMLLESLLSYCIRHNHKVLVFSQFTSLLDIVQDILNLREWKYERLDGSARAEERYASISSFQEKEKDVRVFVLSTRAGGVGLTLTNADTVIFLDNDWNPQNDVQAMARCHRIGQTKKVRVIRLVARYTVEQLIHGRARSKLKLTETLNNEMTRKPAAVNMQDIMQFGLAKLKKTKEETKRLTDEDIERVIGGTDENGEWKELEKNELGIEEEEDVDELDEEDVDQKDYFYFEGKRYRVDKDDTEAMDEEQRNHPEDSTHINKLMTREKREEFVRQVEERKKKRKLEMEEKKRKRWTEAGYSSCNIPLVEDAEDEENDNVDVQYVTGDVTQPQLSGRVIIVHVVDNSGSFGLGGVFSSLDALSPLIREKYEEAGEMGDLSEGDTHLIQFSHPHSDVFVALIVAQRKSRRNELLLSSYANGLRRIYTIAKEKNCTVHVARMSRAITNVTWYSVEKTLKKELSNRGVPLYIYYHPKKRAHNNGATFKRKLEDENEDSPETSSGKRNKRGGIWDGCIVYLSKSLLVDRGRVEEEGGEICDEPLDLYDVTHAIIHSNDSEDPCKEILSLFLPIKDEAYFDLCFQLKRVV